MANGGNLGTNDMTRASLDWWSAFSRTAEVWWTRNAGTSAIAARAAERSAELIRFARAHSPFYRDAWRSLPHA